LCAFLGAIHPNVHFHADEFFVAEICFSKVARDGLLAESLPA
jgi:hypothetical protein